MSFRSVALVAAALASCATADMVVKTVHYQPGAVGTKCHPDSFTIGTDNFDDFQECCNGEEYVAIEEPLDACITQNGGDFYKYQQLPEDLNAAGGATYSKCQYASLGTHSQPTEDTNCVLESARDCEQSALTLNKCTLVYASIDGIAQEATEQAVYSWTKATIVDDNQIVPHTGRADGWLFDLRQYQQNTQCQATDENDGAQVLAVAIHSTRCQRAETLGVAADADIYLNFGNRYDQVSKTAMFCIYYHQKCGTGPDLMHYERLPYLCRRYEVGKCEHDGLKSHRITVEPAVVTQLGNGTGNSMGMDGSGTDALVASAATTAVAGAVAAFAL